MPSELSSEQYWIGLSIGNTHLRWAYFEAANLQTTWVTPHGDLSPTPADWSDFCARSPALAWHQEQGRLPFPLLKIAGVVPSQLTIWQDYPTSQLIGLNDIPIQDLYTTLGVDRALALWGAGQTYGWPMLVVDAGTALTFTAADQNQCLVGGAISPGLGLQISMLAQRTDALFEVPLPSDLPPLWANNTPDAIQAGIVHGTMALLLHRVRDWRQRFPKGNIVMTGGDGARLLKYGLKCGLLNPEDNEMKNQGFEGIVLDNTLLFKGMSRLKI